MACLQVSSVLINCTMWSSYLFTASSCCHVFHGPRFSGSRVFKVPVFQGPGFLRSRFFRVQVFQVPVFSGSRFFWVRVQGLGPGFRSSQSCWPETCNFIKKETLTELLSCDFCEIFKNIFFQNTSGRLLS